MNMRSVALCVGIESALLLAPEAPNYFADAWRERSYTEGDAQARLSQLMQAAKPPRARTTPLLAPGSRRVTAVATSANGVRAGLGHAVFSPSPPFGVRSCVRPSRWRNLAYWTRPVS